jgi:hypothetical protein
MASGTETNIRAGAAPFLHPGESIVAVLIASVRGHQQAMTGGVAGIVGGSRQATARGAADAADIALASPMAFVLTGSRLLSFGLGGRGKTKELLNEFPLSEVGALEVKRLGLGGSVTFPLRGVPVKLESRVGASRVFAAELQRVKGG